MPEIMKLYANLHTHSTHSDGIYTPAELAEIAYNEGYKALVLTDHDTVSGTEDMISECNKRGLECMLGIEFSARFTEFNCNLHITAFHFDPEYPPMKEYLFKLSLKETEQTRILFERGIDIGYIKGITWDEVLEFNKGITWLCNEHVYRAMIAKGLAKKENHGEFFETCYGKYRRTVPSDIKFMEVKDLISFIHEAGGIACVAHPMPPYGSLDYIEKLVEYGIDGIEVWHSMLKGTDRKRALSLAKKYDLYVSGGADHEGLLGVDYSLFDDPMKTEVYFPPLSLGTTKFFYEELRDREKKSNRREIIDELLSNDSLWITNGGVKDRDYLL